MSFHIGVRDILQAQIRSRKASVEAKYDSYTRERTIVAQHVDDEASFSHEGLVAQENRIHLAYFNPKDQSYCRLRCMSDSEELQEPHLSLFKTACFFYDKAEEASPAVEEKVGPLTDSQKNLYRNSTDLASPRKILLDNVQTYFDIFRFVTKDCRNFDEQISAIKKLLMERSKYMYSGADGKDINLNPQHETNMELLTRAPFAFWGGTVRNSAPISINEKAILNLSDANEPLFSSDFIYLVTREHVRVHDPKEGTVEDLVRHGGCPIMHRDLIRSDLVTSFGNVFLEYYESLSKPYSR